MANGELDFDGEEDTGALANETKAERFKRVVNPRAKRAVQRLRLIGQMFEGQNANNYEFTDEQRVKLVALLSDEVERISTAMARRLNGRKDDDIVEI